MPSFFNENQKRALTQKIQWQRLDDPISKSGLLSVIVLPSGIELVTMDQVPYPTLVLYAETLDAKLGIAKGQWDFTLNKVIFPPKDRA